jgi:hypothetical protein
MNSVVDFLLVKPNTLDQLKNKLVNDAIELYTSSKVRSLRSRHTIHIKLIMN